MHLPSFTAFVLASISAAGAFPHYARGDTFMYPGAQPLPPALMDRSSKLVNDAKHKFRAPGKHDERGPCPGLNTLANHGYLPRSGVATPGQIITAVQEGFNMGYVTATLATMAAFIVVGNHETNLMSIGGETPLTGPKPPAPAVAGGLNAHGFFEGDASTTRSDAALGNNHEFNATLFEQLVTAANEFGNGTINLASMAEHRYNRILDSIARNPVFDMSNPRFLTVYSESTFPMRFWVNGTTGYLPDGSMPELDIETARGFFRDGRMPDGFYRREGQFGDDAAARADVDWISNKHPVPPGKNQGVGNYVPDTVQLMLCAVYNRQVQLAVDMYPTQKVNGRLRKALKGNLRTFYATLPNVPGEDCAEEFPYGR